MKKTSKIFIAGHKGLVGSAILKKLQSKGYTQVIVRDHSELDLTDQAAVNAFFNSERPEYVFIAAAYVGGIDANSTYPADFIYRNTMIGFNIVRAAYENNVKKLMNLGSTCIYPKLAPQPIVEEALLTGPLEPTNDAYALAKISIIKLCTSYNRQFGTDYLSVMPTNLYGPNDTYTLPWCHVLPAMINKFHEAKITAKDEVVLWGDGTPLREFLYSEDLADAVIFLMENKHAADIRTIAGDFVNVGSGEELTIEQLAVLVRSIVYRDLSERMCKIVWDISKPNGTPRKLCNISRLLELGWRATTDLKDGIRKSYDDFLFRKIDA